MTQTLISVKINGQTEQLPAGMTVATLLDRLGLTGKPLAVEINGEVVPRTEHAHRVIASGDHIEIVTLVGGG
jgi:sulfur carrier protein